MYKQTLNLKDISSKFEKVTLQELEKVADGLLSIAVYTQLAVYLGHKANTIELFSDPENPDRKEVIRIHEKCFNLSPTKCDNVATNFLLERSKGKKLDGTLI